MKLILILAFAFISFTGFSQTNDAKIKDIKRLLIVSGAASNAKITIDNMVNSMKNSSTQNTLPEGFLDEFTKEINYEEFTDLYVPIYDKHYSHQDILALIAFYESPIGKKMIEKTPAILIESMNAGREWGQKHAMKVYEKLQKKQSNNN